MYTVSGFMGIFQNYAINVPAGGEFEKNFQSNVCEKTQIIFKNSSNS